MFAYGQIHFMNSNLPQLVEKLVDIETRTKTVPCSDCGKLVPIKDVIVWGEKRVLCAECYSKLDIVKELDMKDQGKE